MTGSPAGSVISFWRSRNVCSSSSCSAPALTSSPGAGMLRLGLRPRRRGIAAVQLAGRGPERFRGGGSSRSAIASSFSTLRPTPRSPPGRTPAGASRCRRSAATASRCRRRRPRSRAASHSAAADPAARARSERGREPGDVVVPEPRFEPGRDRSQRCLRPPRLPVPPLRPDRIVAAARARRPPRPRPDPRRVAS